MISDPMMSSRNRALAQRPFYIAQLRAARLLTGAHFSDSRLVVAQGFLSLSDVLCDRECHGFHRWSNAEAGKVWIVRTSDMKRLRF